MSRWWERHAAYFEREKADLDALGWPWEIDEQARARGKLEIHVHASLRGETHRLIVSYPDSYPYFPPQVRAEVGTFGRHQNPADGTLCLLGREGEGWRVGQDTLAGLLSSQLRQIEEVNEPGVTPERVASLEDHAAEPLSIYLTYEPESVVFVADSVPDRSNTVGRLELDLLDAPASVLNNSPLRMALRRVLDSRGVQLVRMEVEPPARKGATVDGFWLRLPQRPALKPGESLDHQLLKIAEQQCPAFQKAMQTAQRGDLLIVGFIYPDEQSWREAQDDWLFVAVRITVGQKRSRAAAGNPVFIRTDWAGRQTLTARAPFLRPLHEKRVLVVGLGTLGSVVTVQLARAGVGQLNLVDADHLQVGNTIRWAAGWEFAGLEKAVALALRLKRDYPYTKVEGHRCRVGVHDNDYKAMYEWVRDADLVIDAAASHPLSNFLADLAWEWGKPYIWLTTTPRAAGGVVGRIVPRVTRCWHCFQRAMANGFVRQPFDAGTADVQPGGCAQPTFVGAGLDSDEISLVASRLAVATLCRGAPDGYPDFEWQAAIADLQAPGLSIAPQWTTYTEWPADPNCPECSRP